MKVYVCILTGDGDCFTDSIMVFRDEQQAKLWQKTLKTAFNDDEPIIKYVEVEEVWKK